MMLDITLAHVKLNTWSWMGT